MATLSTDAPGEVRLTLRGETDNRILDTLRRWPNWLRIDIERDPADSARTLSVTLVADQSHEAIVRDILKRSFSITFPEEGGDVVLPPEPEVRTHRRRW